MLMKNLAAKLIEIRRSISGIHKDGYNEFHKYEYVTASNVSELVKGKLDEYNIMAFISCVDRTRDGTLTTVKLKYTLIDVDSGETLELEWYGDGSDSQDKGIYKAYTGAQKYFWLANLLMPTDDDPENPNKEMREETSSKKMQDESLRRTSGTINKLNNKSNEQKQNQWNTVLSAETKGLLIKLKADRKEMVSQYYKDTGKELTPENHKDFNDYLKKLIQENVK